MTLADRLDNVAQSCRRVGNVYLPITMAELLEEAAQAIRRLEANQAPYREDMGR